MSTINPTFNVPKTGADTADKAVKQPDALDKDAFLQILVTQLKYQDPTQPMENQDFIAQMAQFSSLEQMTNVSKNLDTLGKMQATTQSAALVGRTVELRNPSNAQQPITGTVNKVRFENGEPRLVIGGNEYPLTDLISVL